MSEILIKVGIIVVMTHGFRVVSGLFGPRWGGLLLAMPCSTAIVLFIYSVDNGASFAARAAEHGILGILAAIALAIGRAAGLNRGWNLAVCVALAVTAYLLLSAGLQFVPPMPVRSRMLLSIAGVLVVSALAARITPVASPDIGKQRSPWLRLVLRTGIALACLMTVLLLEDVVGEVWAGLLSTFPSTFLAVTILTCLEAGRSEACRLALAFPAGNLSMVAFVGIFQRVIPDSGLMGALTAGYLGAAIVVLLVNWVLSVSGRCDTLRR